MTTCLCAIVKNENSYICEWVDYHKQLGFNHIYIIDNNDKDGEKPEDVLQPYIQENYVTVINDRGDYRMFHMNLLYRYVYQRYMQKNYDWCAIIDLDEFFYLLDGFTNINVFLQQDKFMNADIISFSWQYYSTDNIDDLFLQRDSNVLDRFNTPSNYVGTPRIKDIIEYKSIINCKTVSANHIKRLHSIATKNPDPQKNDGLPTGYRHIYADGKIVPNENDYQLQHLNCGFIKHIRYKSIEEFFNNKIRKNSAGDIGKDKKLYMDMRVSEWLNVFYQMQLDIFKTDKIKQELFISKFKDLIIQLKKNNYIQNYDY